MFEGINDKNDYRYQVRNHINTGIECFMNILGRLNSI